MDLHQSQTDWNLLLFICHKFPSSRWDQYPTMPDLLKALLLWRAEIVKSQVGKSQEGRIFLSQQTPIWSLHFRVLGWKLAWFRQSNHPPTLKSYSHIFVTKPTFSAPLFPKINALGPTPFWLSGVER